VFKTETQLTLCDSALGYCAGGAKKRKDNVWPKAATAERNGNRPVTFAVCRLSFSSSATPHDHVTASGALLWQHNRNPAIAEITRAKYLPWDSRSLRLCFDVEFCQ
jgi:hypothetical protein